MKQEYDFEKAKRGAVARPKGKTRITIYLDEEMLRCIIREELRKI